eukprot:7776017-Pyramimonas_sp.AAC.1
MKVNSGQPKDQILSLWARPGTMTSRTNLARCSTRSPRGRWRARLPRRRAGSTRRLGGEHAIDEEL